ncbi:MAG: Gfo/Idh/MocA family oxidoreductase [Clostridia bacterium]|nr:Gfo/Idh/MocA family oxidoreductase [Clostridia bacterium]
MKTAIYGVWHVHAPDYTRTAQKHGEVVGFYEPDDALAKAFGDLFGLPRFATPEELLASDAEGVIVCSATNTHADDMVKIARAGKHIFTEKVLALTDEDCERVAEAVRESGVTFTISLFQKYLASRRAVKAVCESGELGNINYLRFRNCHSGSSNNWLPAHFYNREQCGGGAMIDLGAHGMYLTHWILGEPISARSAFTLCNQNPDAAKKNVDGVEDNAVTVMTFESGAIAVGETGFVSCCSPVTFEVHGDKGYVYMEKDRVIKCTQATGGKQVEVELPEALPLPIEQFVTGNVLPGCGMDEAKALTHMMVMAYN